MGAAVRFLVCGPFRVRVDGAALTDGDLGSRKARTLLKVIVLERGRLVPADRLADLLWGDDQPRDAAANLATLVSRLRRTLGGEVIVGGRAAYGLATSGRVTVDMDDASRLADEAEVQLATGAPALALAAAQRALQILGNDAVLADDPGAEWAEQSRTHAESMRRHTRSTAVTAALHLGDAGTAVDLAEDAAATDEIDEAAHRLLMRALVAAGRQAHALAVYARLRDALADGLGMDPDAQTQQLHMAILRGETRLDTPAPTTSRRPAPGSHRHALVGREDEVKALIDTWAGVVTGAARLVLVAGEAGIGKTRLTEEVARRVRDTGGAVLSARCYSAERSLFLAPVVAALSPTLLAIAPDRLTTVAGAHAGPLVELLPALAPLLGSAPGRGWTAPAEVVRRRAYEAVAAVLEHLGREQPTLVLLDDVHNAGRSTLDLLHYLVRHLPSGRVLMLATVRAEEGSQVLDQLSSVATRCDVGPLPASAVAALAGAAGQADRADSLVARTRGHTLSVVEMLRGWESGDPSVPDTLTQAIEARVRRAGSDAQEWLRAAAVLGVTVDPQLLAALMEASPTRTARVCESLLMAHLLIEVGAVYEFANDLVQEVVYAAMPKPTRTAYHRRAADLLADRPESLARHADAVGDWARAARGWILAADQALRRGSTPDAESLLDQAIDSADRANDPALRGRAYYLRARAREGLSHYDEAWADLDAAHRLATESGDARLQVAVLRLGGGDISMARGAPAAESEASLEDGLRIAHALGDRAAMSDLLARHAVVSCNRLRFDVAVTQASRAVELARSADDRHTLVVALDGLKTGYAYLGDVASLGNVLAELTPILRRDGDPFLLQWTVFESSFPALAAGEWDRAADLMTQAMDVSRGSGFTAHAAFYRTHFAWLHRLAGNLEIALDEGAEALRLAERTGHAWWVAAAAGQHAASLLAAGNPAESAAVATRGLETLGSGGGEAYRLRCLAPLAHAGCDKAVVDEAEQLLLGLTAPPGKAWILGADCYLDLARALTAAGEPDRAAGALAPLLAATSPAAWSVVRDQAMELSMVR